jgi:DNA-binding NarL/FixJ family response regulator
MEPTLFHSTTPDAPTVVMLAVFGQDGLTDDAMRVGTPGYLLQSHDPQMLLAAITEVSRGIAPCSGGIARQVTVHMNAGHGAPREDAGLSPREKQVLQCLVDGLSYKMIADQLTISFETVRSHIKRIYEKLHVHNNTEAVVKAIKAGLAA